jgi:hypothetical protein
MESQATLSLDALRSFMAEAFSTLQTQLSQKIENNDASLSKLTEIQTKLREEIQSGNLELKKELKRTLGRKMRN